MGAGDDTTMSKYFGVYASAALSVALACVTATTFGGEPTRPLTTAASQSQQTQPAAAPDSAQRAEQNRFVISQGIEIELLKAQLSDARGFQSDLLSTVYWSLGVVVGIVALLVGYNWFTNFKIYEREKASLLEELKTQLASTMLDERQESEDRLKTAIEASSQPLVASIQALKRDLEVSITEATEHSRWRDNFETARFEELRAELAIEKKSFTMATTFAIRMMESAIDCGSETHMSDSAELLEKALDNGGLLTAAEQKEAPILLKKLPKHIRDERQKLAEKIEKAGLL
jgi:hypothetical protein